MSRPLWAFEKTLQTRMMTDSTSDQIVAWLKSDDNNEDTLRVHGDEWLAMNDVRVNAAIAMYGQCERTLEQLFLSTINTGLCIDLLKAIAANPHINIRTKDQILDRWLQADGIRDKDYEVALCLFLNPEIRPFEVMTILTDSRGGRRPEVKMDVKRQLHAVQYLTMNARNNDGWYESNLNDINHSGLFSWLLRLLCHEEVLQDDKPLFILDFLFPLLKDEHIATQIDLKRYREPLAFLDIDLRDRSLPTVEEIDRVLASCHKDRFEYEEDNIELSCLREFFCKVFLLASGQPDWQRSFADSRDEHLRATFFTSAPYRMIFKHANQLGYDIDERYFHEKEKLDYEKLPNGELLAELDNLETKHSHKFMDWMSENLSFYKDIRGRKFLRQLNLFLDYFHKEARESCDTYEEDFDDRPRPLDVSDLREINEQEESTRRKLDALEAKIQAIAQDINKIDISTADVLDRIKSDLQDLRAEVNEDQHFDRGYLINLIRAILGIR